MRAFMPDGLEGPGLLGPSMGLGLRPAGALRQRPNSLPANGSNRGFSALPPRPIHQKSPLMRAFLMDWLGDQDSNLD
ncbi:MAG: hypothetical protein CMH65_02105 [Nevskiales bacterium]|nr:hypothetical protein [Nevskiales bacterium]